MINAISKSKDIDADIVEATNFISHLIALQIAKAKNIPSVAWYPDVWIGEWVKNAGPVGIFGEILERFNLKLGFSSYIAISKQTAEKLKKHTSAKINIIPCGVEPKEFTAKTKKENRIICVSRLVRYKRVKDLILAYARVQKENKDLSLLIIGRGPEEKNLKDLVNNLHLHSKVIFKANLKRKGLTNAIKSSKLMCIPSEVEGFGISLIEAVAASVPYVASDISVFKEITKNGKGGLHFELGNLPDLVLKIEKLLNSKTLYIKKVREGVTLLKYYNWRKIASSTEQIYKHLV